MLRLSQITKSFPGVKALDRVSLEVKPGEVHALVGENGAGKSTLVKILGGAYVPDEGLVEVDGNALPAGDPALAREQGVSIIYQEFNLIPALSVEDNIFLGQERRRGLLVDQAQTRKQAQDLLDSLGCKFTAHSIVEDLSVGARQLVEIARALSVQAKVLVFDEPSATLTDVELELLFATIQQLRDQGLAIVYISHRLEEVFELCSQVTVLRDGQHVATSEVSEIDRHELIRQMVGRSVEDEFNFQARELGENFVELNHLSCPPYFSDVSLNIRKGEILGLAGLVGAGRTSVGLCLLGVLKAVGGSFKFGGKETAFLHPSEALASGVAYLTEDRKGKGIFAELGVGDNITISSLNDFCLEQFSWSSIISESKREHAAQESSEQFDVRTASLKKEIMYLSGGNQQKALIARLLRHPLKLLIIDEPTRGVDIGARSQIYQLIYELAAKGLSILVISSDLPELLGICDRIEVMNHGMSMGSLTRDEATQEAIMELATRVEGS